MGKANAFLIEGDDGLTLIDAGYPGKEAAVFGAIRGLGRSPDQLKHLIFTHGHPDHIGSAAAIVRETGARSDERSAIGSDESNQFSDLFRKTGASQRNSTNRVHDFLPCGTKIRAGLLAISSIKPCAPFVSMKPGATVLTRTPRGATCLESALL